MRLPGRADQQRRHIRRLAAGRQIPAQKRMAQQRHKVIHPDHVQRIKIDDPVKMLGQMPVRDEPKEPGAVRLAAQNLQPLEIGIRREVDRAGSCCPAWRRNRQDPRSGHAAPTGRTARSVAGTAACACPMIRKRRTCPARLLSCDQVWISPASPTPRPPTRPAPWSS